MTVRFKALEHATDTRPKVFGFVMTSDPIHLKHSLYF